MLIMGILFRAILPLLCSITLGLSMYEYYTPEQGTNNAISTDNTSFQDEESFDVLQHQIDSSVHLPQAVELTTLSFVFINWQPYICQTAVASPDGRLPLRGPPSII